jgi:antitoxin ParD1/3/4
MRYDDPTETEATMDSPLTTDTERRIAEKVANGPYESGEEVIDKALTLLDAHEAEQAEKLEWLRDAIQKGIDSGPSVPADDAFWENIKAEGKTRAEVARESKREAGR